MVFSSLTFLYFFLPAALVCYHILPKRAIGISFYTFQAMSYVIDVSRGKVPTAFSAMRPQRFPALAA